MYEINPEYSNSRPVNYNRWSDHKEVDALVTKLIEGIKSREKSVYFKNMKVLMLDLYQSYHVDQEQWVGIHRSSNHYDFINKRFLEGHRYTYNPHITFDGFVRSVDLLHEAELIEYVPGGHFYNDEQNFYYGFLPRIRANRKLFNMWMEYGIKPHMVKQFKEMEVIILRDEEREVVINEGLPTEKTIKVKSEINYPETRRITRMRKVVQAYNRMLSKTHIDCDIACMSDQDKEDIKKKLLGYSEKRKREIKVKLQDKSVYRVFNNGKWDEGGRFYGAWWIGCPSIVRRYITLNGDPTVELDYSGIHIHLLYAQKGINYAARREDPYILDDGIPNRDINKKILLTAINATTARKAARSAYYELQDDEDIPESDKPTLKIVFKKLKLLKAKHHPIADKIASGEGIRLQYLDSCVIEKLVSWSLEVNIPILTIHDSVICPAHYEDLVKDRMWIFYVDLIQEKLNLNITYGNSSPMGKHLIRAINQHSKVFPVKPIQPIQNIKPLNNIINNTTVRYWLKPDDIIKIKRDSVELICSRECSHYKRIKDYNSKGVTYLNTLVINLREECNSLNIKD